MLSVALPDDDAGAVFAACAARTQEAAKRTALLARRRHVEERAVLYLDHAHQNALHDFEPTDSNSNATRELRGLYNRVLVSGGERPLYLRLRGGSRYNRCPLCGQRDVKTLDHYLSKNEYPELSVFPANLVPSCFECNHAKSEYRAECKSGLLFHPYFDDWSQTQLIEAVVNVGAGVAASYTIRTPGDVDMTIVQRARRHFEKFGLGALYGQHAAVELVERKRMFRSTFETDGIGGLRAEMAREAQSRSRFNRNSWQSALYRALSLSDKFCGGGFESIDEP